MDSHLWIAVNYKEDKAIKNWFDENFTPDEKHFFLCNGEFFRFVFMFKDSE